MKKIHLNAVKIFLFLVTAILGEGLSSSGEIKVNVLVIIKRGKGGRQIISVYLVSSQSESRAFRLISFVLTVRHFLLYTMPISLTVFSQLFLPPPLHAASLWISLYSLLTYIVLLGGTSTPTFLLNMAYQFVCGILEDLENKIRHL